MTDSTFNSNETNSAESLETRLRTMQAERWQRGEGILVEEILQTNPEVADKQEFLMDLIYAEVLYRENSGEKANVEDFVKRFPTLEESIRRQFAVHAGLPRDELLMQSSENISPTPNAPRKGSSTEQDFSSNDQLTIPQYRIEQEVGRGGMGVVYRATHLKLKRSVAIKVLRDRVLADATTLARFRSEAEAIARLQHPNIVQIYDFGEYNGLPYLALEFVEGETLSAWCRGPLRSIPDCLRLLEIVSRAIGHAHRAQIVHRDLKPANILLALDSPSSIHDSSTLTTDEPLRATWQPKITDFGLAKLAFNEDHQLTKSEAILGTAAYLSPEQAWGNSRDVGPGTDIYALGVILFELLTGQTPFAGPTMVHTLDNVRFQAPRKPSELRLDVSPELDAVCLRCLEKQPDHRYSSAELLADDLANLQRGHPIAAHQSSSFAESQEARRRKKRTWLIGSGVAFATLLLASFAFVMQGNRDGKASVQVPPPRTVPAALAFLVGVRSYEFKDGRVDLEFTESDVDELSRSLNKRGWDRSNIQLLSQWAQADNPNLAPTADNIRQQLKLMLAKCIPEDTLLLMITGMGGEAGDDSYCYLPADANLDKPETLIHLSELYELLEDCAATRKVLIIDTCQTTSLRSLHWPTRPVPKDVAVLMACSPRQLSYEDPKLRHGVFSYYLLKALEGEADRDNNQQVNLDELWTFTKSNVQKFLDSEKPGELQTPVLFGTLPTTTPILPAIAK